jgi:hypothetical protein
LTGVSSLSWAARCCREIPTTDEEEEDEEDEDLEPPVVREPEPDE